jgi:antibiotic biosynthesis monooxygenase (ABM) superfamily enzyme
MPLFVEKPITITLQVEIKSEANPAFIDWQTDFSTSIVNAPGFLSLEFSLPIEQQNYWSIVQRFINSELSHEWRNSKEYKRLMNDLKALATEKKVKIEENDEFSKARNITEIIMTEVNPGMEKNYHLWSAKIHQCEAKFPGFRGVYIQPPTGMSKHWITLLQFDTTANLERWLESIERKQILDESTSFISSLESHRVISPFAGWFASIAKIGEIPPVWKQTMLILLVLFPIVMLELKYLSPLTSDLNSSVATFIGNALSVTLISFPLMPIAISLLGWWLMANDLKMNISGTLLVGFLYLIEIILFAFS